MADYDIAKAVHTHAEGDVVGLSTKLTNLTSVTNSLSTSKADVSALEGKADVSHTHEVADVTGLQADLDGKQAAGDYATSSALTSGLAGKANTVHTHTATQVNVAEYVAGEVAAGDLQAVIQALADRIAALETAVAELPGVV